MSFSENLINLRKRENLSQEQLAEKLDISRQAVSKWESGGGYPEMDKLMFLCELFECSLDTLMKGKISEDTIGLKSKYTKFYDMYTKATTFCIGLIFLGVILFMAMAERTSTIALIVLLIAVFITVPVFIYLGMKEDDFKKKNPKLPYLFSEAEVEAFHKKYPMIIAFGVCLILVGVILFLVFSESNKSNTPILLLLVCITFAISIFTYFGLQKNKFDIDHYNRYNKYNEDFQKESNLVGKICGVIMLVAVTIYLCSILLRIMYQNSWIVFPIAGILCGIVAIIFNKD